MSARGEQARKFVVARPARFVERSEGLMNDQDVHGVCLILNQIQLPDIRHCEPPLLFFGGKAISTITRRLLRSE